jgi:hypothetical protein
MATVCAHLSVEELEERYVRCQDATGPNSVSPNPHLSEEPFDLSTAMPGWKCSCTLGKPP